MVLAAITRRFGARAMVAVRVAGMPSLRISVSLLVSLATNGVMASESIGCLPHPIRGQRATPTRISASVSTPVMIHRSRRRTVTIVC